MRLKYTSSKSVAACEVRQGVDLDVTLQTATEMTVTVTEKAVMVTKKAVTATEKAVTAGAPLEDWLHKDTVERLAPYQYENTVERLALYQYKDIFHKISILLTHSILLKHLKLFTFLSPYLLISLPSYLCTFSLPYNLTILQPDDLIHLIHNKLS